MRAQFFLFTIKENEMKKMRAVSVDSVLFPPRHSNAASFI